MLCARVTQRHHRQFALGTNYGDESDGWKYSYCGWKSNNAVASGVDLYREINGRMHEEGLRMAFVDPARSNSGAIKFFRRMGYGKPEAEVWMRKMLQRTRKAKNDQEIVTAT